MADQAVPDAVNEHALEFLGNLERAEVEVLTWGLVDGFFSEAEIEERAQEFLAALASRGVVAAYSSAWDLVEALLEDDLLWKLPGIDRYRTRMAETVRLFARLRQIFPDTSDSAWRTAPRLVADYCLAVRQRTYRRRDVPPNDVGAAIRLECPLSAFQEQLLRGLVRSEMIEER